MNINKLADLLDECIEDGSTDLVCVQQAANMLRQQQAEIEALKKDNKELHAIAQRMAMAESDARKSLQWFKDAKERQNEPVAWMYQIHDITGWTWVIDQRLPDYEYRNEKPLYTHPAKTDKAELDTRSYMLGYADGKEVKTLTDEEIDEIVMKQFGESRYDFFLGTWRDFARAILRKASEK